MSREQFGTQLDEMVENIENLINDYCKSNETLRNQAILLMRRSTRMVKFSMYSQDSDEITPTQIVEKEKELVDRANNDILNEIKRINNIKKFNQDKL